MSAGAIDGAASARAEKIFATERYRLWRSTDHLFAGLILFQWVAGFIAALVISPHTWVGAASRIHPHVWFAALGGGIIAFLPIALALVQPGKASTRQAIAVAQALTSALLIHLMGGRIETHFHVFGSLAFLAVYQDWRVLVTFSAVVAADHLLRGIYWPQSVYGVLTASPWRAFEHAGWVLFEDAVLLIAIRRGVSSARELAVRQAEAEQTNVRIEAVVQARTAELAASEERFRSLAAASPLGIFQFDVGGIALWANQRWSTILGIEGEDAIKDGWLRSIHPDDRDEIVGSWREQRDSDDFEREYRILRGGADLRWIQVRTRPTRDASGRITGYVGTGADVTERRRAADELLQAKEAALAGSRAKSEFLATMSHEIRTPMNAVIGMTTLLLDGDLPAQQRDSLQTIRSSGESLLAIINDILDFSKIEQNKLTVEKQPFAMRTCLAQVLQMFAFQARAKGLDLASEIASDVPERMIGDATRVRQVLVNLIGNAIKFTEEGSVKVRVSTSAPEAATLTVCVQVEDTGIGMSSEETQRLFEPFSQADSSTTRRYGGTGLGLAISRRISELLGGGLQIQTAPGLGSTFTFTFQADAEASAFGASRVAGAAPAQIDRELASRWPLRVLVAEDNPINQKVALSMLKRMGYRADVAGNGLEALAALDRQPYDLILMDMQMPEMDGLEASREICRRLAWEERPRIVALTANASDADRSQCLEAGMDDFLSKPVAVADLAAVLEAQARARADRRRDAASKVEPAAA